MKPTDPVATRRAHQRRPWRWAFAVYAIGLTTGTHWPELQFGPEIPASDKLVHFLAFGGLAYFLWRTGWIGSRWLLALVGIAWTVADELTQGIPGLHRTITGEDIVASSLGVVTMTTWLWALRPVGAEQSRRRHALVALAFDELFARPSTWLLFALHLAACILPVLLTRPFVSADWTARAIVFATLAWVVTVSMLLNSLWTREIARLRRRRSCLACAAPSMRPEPRPEPGPAPDGPPSPRVPSASALPCRACGAALRPADWRRSPHASRGSLLRAAVPPIALGAGLVVATALIVAVSAYLYAYAISAGSTTSAPRAARYLGRLPRTLLLTIDFSAILVVLGVACSLTRSRLTRQLDQAARCRHCGHDLAGTPIEDGAGRCGECGTPFVDPEAAP